MKLPLVMSQSRNGIIPSLRSGISNLISRTAGLAICLLAMNPLSVALGQTPYDLSASSYLGGSSLNDEVVASVIQPNGVVVLAAQIGNANPGGVSPVLLNGSNSTTSGSIIRLSANGRQVLSVTRLANTVHDLSVDSSGNLYVAAEGSGLIKLNASANQVLFQHNPGGNIFRLDASPNGTVVGLWDSYNVGDMGTAQRAGTIRVLSSTGSLLGSFSGHHLTTDVVLYQPSQSVISIGWRNANSPYNPVQISYIRSQSYNGTQNWKGYDWAASLLDAPGSTNNMADSRGHRISLGEDGKLYALFEVAGGNHIFRYSPFDLLSPVTVVGGDNYHNFFNTKSEHKTFWARYEPTTGDYIRGQQLTARLSNGNGNTVRNRLGEIQADAAGRVYLTGVTFFTLPYMNTHIPNFVTSGGFMLAMNANFTERLFLGGLAQGGVMRTVAVRTLPGQTHPNIVFGGHTVATAYLVSPIQSTPSNFQDGIFAVIDQTGGGGGEVTPLPISGFSSSSAQSGNPASNAFDSNLNTRWSAQGIGQWLQVDLGSVQTVSGVGTAYYLGNERVYLFEVRVSSDGSNWTTVLNTQSTGSTLDIEIHSFAAQQARYVRFWGKGHTAGNWNNVTEYEVYGTAPGPIEPDILPISSFAASSAQSGNPASNAFDNNLSTRWAASGVGQWLQVDLGSVRSVSGVGTGFYLGNQRVYLFEIRISTDGSNWTTILDTQSTGTTLDIEMRNFTSQQARYVRFWGKGYTGSSWNAVTEFEVYGN